MRWDPRVWRHVLEPSSICHKAASCKGRIGGGSDCYAITPGETSSFRFQIESSVLMCLKSHCRVKLLISYVRFSKLFRSDYRELGMRTNTSDIISLILPSHYEGPEEVERPDFWFPGEREMGAEEKDNLA